MWRLLCALFCFVMLLPASFSQNLRLEKVNAENFPELQVFIHDRNPESTDNANIILSENTQKLNAEDYKISYSQKDYQFRQLTFILFENSFWDSYNKQRDYFKKVLDDALSSFSEEPYGFVGVHSFSFCFCKGKVRQPKVGQKIAGEREHV